jgi:VanZ family protein
VSARPTKSPPAPRAARLLWPGFFLWAATVTILSSIPGQRLAPMPFTLGDKVVHFALFFAGALLLGAAIRQSTRWPWLRIMLCVSAAIALLGVLDEMHQLWTPGRSGADPADMAADALGGICGVVFLRLLYGIGQRKRNGAGADLGSAAPDRAA